MKRNVLNPKDDMAMVMAKIRNLEADRDYWKDAYHKLFALVHDSIMAASEEYKANEKQLESVQVPGPQELPGEEQA